LVSDRIRPDVADGSPISGDLVAVVDESSPQNAAGGVSYVVAVAAMFEPAQASASLNGLFEADRRRPFHWEREGPIARNRIIEIASEIGVSATAFFSHVSRKGQKHTRTEIVDRIARLVAADGVEHLIIEASDEATIGRDRHAILKAFDGVGGAPFTYDWRSKSERLLWIADAVAGATAEFVTDRDSTWANRLLDAGVMTVVPHP
jgi:hypothetical protein